MIYIVIPINVSNRADLEKRILRLSDKTYMDYKPQFYALKYEGNSEALSRALGFGEDPEYDHGIILSLANYYGYANGAFWEWINVNR